MKVETKDPKPRYRMARYGRRSWAVYRASTLLCVTIYKIGAQTVVQMLNDAPSDVGKEGR